MDACLTGDDPLAWIRQGEMTSLKAMVFYDLDGTLADTRKDIAFCVNLVLKELGRPGLDQAGIEKFVGRGLKYLIGNCLKSSDKKLVERGAVLFRDFYAEHMLDFTELYPGAREVLGYFRNRRQAVVTNKPNPFSKEMLEGLGISAYFSDVIPGNSEAYPRKPDPAAVEAILVREGVLPQDALLIGDSPIDIETGKNAGIETAVVIHGFSSEAELREAAPDHIFADFAGLLRYARSAGW